MPAPNKPNTAPVPREAGDRVPPASMPAELVKELVAVQKGAVEVQREQTEVKKLELEVEKQKDSNLYNFNTEILNKQSSDRHETRLSRERVLAKVLLFSFGIVIIVATILIYAISQNKDDLAKRILEMLFTFLGGSGVGGVVGFSFGKKNKDKGNSDKE